MKDEGQREGQPGEDDSLVERIEIEFAIPCWIPIDAQREIADIVQAIAKLPQNVPVGHVHWQSGVGAKPNWSQADQRFLGKPVDPNAPDSGEPTFDDTVLHFETSCRERYPGERR